MRIFSFVKKVFFLGLTVLSSSITSALKCVSLNNQEFKVRPKIVNVSNNNSIFYPFSVKINRSSGNCNNIGYLTIKKICDCYDVNGVNPLHLRIDNASGYIKEDWTHKFLIFDSTDKNKELLKRYDDVFNEIMSKI